MTCSRDTNGDGNCGRVLCPECGVVPASWLDAETRAALSTPLDWRCDDPNHNGDEGGRANERGCGNPECWKYRAPVHGDCGPAAGGGAHVDVPR